MRSRLRLDLAALLLIVIAAAAARVSGSSWDLHRLLHPDERFLVATTARLSLPSSVGQYLDPDRSPLNPRQPGAWFAYGSLPTTLNRLVLGVARVEHSAVAAAWTGRALSAAADVFTVILVFAIGRRLYDRITGLLAAFLYASTVLAIQQSHFFVVDTFLTTACTATVAALVCARNGRSPWAAAAAGAGIGLACACKVTGVLLVAPAGAAWAVALWRSAATDSPSERRRDWRAVGGLLLVGVLATLATAKLASPDAFAATWSFMPGDLWLADVRNSLRGAAGEFDWPPDHQWAGRTQPWFTLWNMVVVGLGPALGFAALVGLAVAGWRLLADWRLPHLVPVVWTTALFAGVGTSQVASLRYLLPAYPMLCLLAAWWIVAATRRPSRRPGVWLVARITAGVVVGATIAWAVAFTAIYRDPHTRVTASRWIYDHIPPGTAIAAEAWDDALPLVATPRERPERYRILTFPVTDQDSASKLEALVQGLATVDYVVLSSDRNALTLPRIPQRFPLMVRYYAALDDGSLGFERVAAFTSYPRLGPMVFPSTTAEEAFSVYDHPRVRIYRKRPGTSAESLRATFASVRLDEVVNVSAQQLSRAPTLLQLAPGRVAALEHEGTWSRWAGPGGRFTPASRQPGRALWLWCLALGCVWVAAWPATAVVFAQFDDRGWMAAPALGLLWVSWVGWMWGSVTPWPVTRGAIAWAFVSLPLMSVMMAWRDRHTLTRWMRANAPLIVRETVFLVVVGALMVAVRSANPDLWHPTHGGEKPMDFAILNAIVRADHFPPFDPWFAGGTLNYYYFGFVPVAMLSRAMAIEPALAYTLALGTWFAMTAGLALSITATMAASMWKVNRAWVAGLAGALLATVSGNLVQWRVLRAWWNGTMSAVAPFWDASRAIPVPAGAVVPITEFPFFTFLFGDLHAHLLAMPWFLLGVAIALQVVCARRTQGSAPPSVSPVLLAVAGLVVGALSATNTWDVPTLSIILAATLVVACCWQVPAPDWPERTRSALVRVAVIVGVAVLAFHPFWANYAAPVEGVGLWRGPRTPPGAWLAIWGPFALVQLPFLGLCVEDVRRRRLDMTTAWCAGLSCLGLALIVGVEAVVTRGDTGRMNTVFKFYLQAWLLWSMLTAAAWHHVWRRLGEWSRPVQRAFAILSAALLIATLAYPMTAPWWRVAHRVTADARRGLDGTSFLEASQLPAGAGMLPASDDLAVIRWFLGHVAGTPVIIEAQTPAYQWGARISSFTGLPTVLGWSWHTRQQRGVLPADVVARRARAVRRFYESDSIDEADRVASDYNVAYAVVGGVERARYAGAGLDKFADASTWHAVFSAGDTVVYQRRR